MTSSKNSSQKLASYLLTLKQAVVALRVLDSHRAHDTHSLFHSLIKEDWEEITGLLANLSVKSGDLLKECLKIRTHPNSSRMGFMISASYSEATAFESQEQPTTLCCS